MSSTSIELYFFYFTVSVYSVRNVIKNDAYYFFYGKQYIYKLNYCSSFLSYFPLKSGNFKIVLLYLQYDLEDYKKKIKLKSAFLAQPLSMENGDFQTV